MVSRPAVALDGPEEYYRRLLKQQYRCNKCEQSDLKLYSYAFVIQSFRCLSVIEVGRDTVNTIQYRYNRYLAVTLSSVLYV